MSLVLVLAMVFSFAATAFAVDTGYADDEKIQNKTAVAVMSGMGIINGKDDNKFEPTDTFKRSEAAKIMTYMLLGPDAAEALKATTDPFPDVAKSDWFAPYVAYVAREGLVIGWEGKYHPQEPLTCEQWLKMLLGTLGYDTTNLKGDNWEASTRAMAIKAGIVTADELKLDFNRDTAVLYAWNALWAPVEGKAASYVVTVDGKEHEFTSMVDAVLYLAAIESDAEITIDTENTLGDEVFDLVYNYDIDEFARPETSYTYNSGNKHTDIDQAAAATYTTAVSAETIIKDLNDRGANIRAVRVDGYYNDNATTKVKGCFTPANEKKNEIGGQGVLTEIYRDLGPNAGEHDYVMVQINTYVQELTGLTKYSRDITLTDGNVKIPVGEHENGDVISYNVGRGEKSAVAYNVTTLDGKAGTITTQNKTHEYICIDKGDQVKLNKNAEKNTNKAASFDTDCTVGTSYTFYYDTYGNVLYLGKAPMIINDVAFVLEVETLKDPAKSHLINPSKDEYVSAMLVLTLDGEVKLLDRALVEKPDGTYFANLSTVAQNETDNAERKVDGYVGYTPVVDQFREIGEVEGGYAICHNKHNVEVSALVNGNNKIKVDGKEMYVTNKTNVTVFTYDRMSKSVVKTDTYTGYDNFPKDETTYQTAYVVTRGDVVTDIYAVVNPVPVEEEVWAVYSHEGSNIEGELGYMFYVDGTLTRYTLDKSFTGDKFTDANENWAYKLKIKDGKITGYTRNFVVDNMVVDKNEADYIVIGNDSYFIDEDTVIVDANQKFDIVDVKTIAVGTDKVAVAASQKGGRDVAEFIYIYPGN